MLELRTGSIVRPKTAPVDTEDAQDSSTSNCSGKSNPSSVNLPSGEADNEDDWSEPEQQGQQQSELSYLSDTSCCDTAGILSSLLTGTSDCPSHPAQQSTFARSSLVSVTGAPQHDQYLPTKERNSHVGGAAVSETEVVVVMAAVTALHLHGSRGSVHSAALLRSHLLSERCLASLSSSPQSHSSGAVAAATASAAVFALANATIASTRPSSTDCSLPSIAHSYHCTSSGSASRGTSDSPSHRLDRCSSNSTAITRSLRNHPNGPHDQQRLSHGQGRTQSQRHPLPQKSSSQKHARAQLMYDHWHQHTTAATAATTASTAVSSSGVSHSSSFGGADAPTPATAEWRIKASFNAPNTSPAHQGPTTHAHPTWNTHAHQQPTLPSWPEVSTGENNLCESGDLPKLGMRFSNHPTLAAAADERRVTLLEAHTRSFDHSSNAPAPQRKAHPQRIVLGQDTTGGPEATAAVRRRAHSGNGGTHHAPHRHASTVAVSAVNAVAANAWAGALLLKVPRTPTADPLPAPPGWIGPLGHESQQDGSSSCADTSGVRVGHHQHQRQQDLRSSDSSPTGSHLRRVWQEQVVRGSQPGLDPGSWGSPPRQQQAVAAADNRGHYRSEQRYCQHLQPKAKGPSWVSTLLQSIFGGCVSGGAGGLDGAHPRSRSSSFFGSSSFNPGSRTVQQQSSLTQSGSSAASKQRFKKSSSLLRGLAGRQQFASVTRRQLDVSAAAADQDSSTTSNSGRMPWLQHADPAGQRFT
ncbi:MAG: hypothetical protein WDW36_000959 [Sanguina aurantia]